MRELRSVLALDPRLKVIVAHGFTDLVTPYFETKLLLDQLPAFGDEARVKLEVFPGGHMFYSRDASRQVCARPSATWSRPGRPLRRRKSSRKMPPTGRHLPIRQLRRLLRCGRSGLGGVPGDNGRLIGLGGSSRLL